MTMEGVLVIFSSLFMVLGALFCVNAWTMYEEAKDLMQSVVDLIYRDIEQEARNGGTDAD